MKKHGPLLTWSKPPTGYQTQRLALLRALVAMEGGAAPLQEKNREPRKAGEKREAEGGGGKAGFLRVRSAKMRGKEVPRESRRRMKRW